ncbi:unnamed protein product [Rotaria sordida]|uniref:Uncharacterized protein n=1 Tax=Rotaria sordida TaxID=392033 RepID=A0A813PT61_9BILA|nr:unnamed protein product [Rotaria sordida]CAF0756476.1 unnamed protein product [Rotaria sordida]CAF0757945.1 unnamed protein product [Rotaria sordida]CAF0781330.1 unnamed protein product [Rotaria sordida]CAF0801160.1 unnamed protein product [Rotaria sordida]
MANSRLLLYLTMMMVMFLLIEQSYEVYIDCQARCMLAMRHERNRDTLQMCRDECELLEILDQQDPREGKYYKYRSFK